MPRYEYKVVPAPLRGEKARGARTTADRFAHALMHVMNDLGRDGWDYVRADTLPCEERVGLTGKSTSFLHMLVFRRLADDPVQPMTGPAPSAGLSGEPLAQAAESARLRAAFSAVASEGSAPRVTSFSKLASVPAAAGPASNASRASTTDANR